MVGRFVQQQHVRLFQQQAALGHAAALHPGEVLDLGIPGRQAQGVGRALQLVFHVVAALGGDDVFLQLALLAGQLVEVGVRIGVGRIDLVQARHGAFHLADRLFDRLAHRLLRIQLGLLGQVADLDAGLRTGFPFDPVSMPAMMRSRVDLPAPFRPSTPILAPGKKEREMFLRI